MLVSLSYFLPQIFPNIVQSLLKILQAKFDDFSGNSNDALCVVSHVCLIRLTYQLLV